MYEQHFGLTKRLFGEHVRGADVFVGPQAAAAISGLKKALARPDAVATVAGPAGSGKTTLVMKALGAMGPTFKAFRIGRMHLSGTDAIEFLLEALGVTKLPNGAVRRFNTFRRVLSAAQAENIRIVIVIEDAIRAGVGTLAELEALTAADGGLSDGANLVLMGNDGLPAVLQDAQLERLAQRTRHRQSVVPMNTAELRGYLMHAFRQAGGDFDATLAGNTVEVLHQLSGGIPRMANNVLEAAMNAAAAAGDRRIDGAFLAAVGNEEFGLDADVPPVEADEPAPSDEPAPIDEPAPPVAEDEAAPATPEPDADSVTETETSAEPIIVFSDEPMAADDDEDIPELIQDTLPDLEVLAPDVVGASLGEADESGTADDDVEPVPVGTFEPVPAPADAALPTLEAEPQDLPELQPITAAEPAPEPEPVTEPEPEPEPAPEPEPVATTAPIADLVSSADVVPEWERDPTLAELKPDLDALERAMAFAQGDDEGEPPLADDIDHKPAQAGAEPEEIPEITLDHAIQERFENKLIDEPGEISPTDQPAAAEDGGNAATSADGQAPKKSKMADAEIERIASELAKAKTIEDVDDKLAETLFGEEINLIAAQVLKNAAHAAPANDEELQLFDTAAAHKAQAAGSSPAADTASIDVSLETRESGGEAGLDLSASQRLKTVRALNADLHPSLREPGNGPDPGPDVPAREVATPDPIEDQINTSMTQTLKALNVHPPTLDRNRDDDDDDGSRKNGFFSRFRRS